MVTQTLVSFKVDNRQLALLDDLCLKLGVKRNKLLNFLVFYANVTLNDVTKLNLMLAYSKCFVEE